MLDVGKIRIGDFDYLLPDERVAKFPCAERDGSKLLVYRGGVVTEDRFFNVGDYLERGELVVMNNTRVIQARLRFRKESGAQIEVFCLEPYLPKDYVLSFQQTGRCSWLCMIGNLRKWKGGVLRQVVRVNGKDVVLTAECKGVVGTSYEVEFVWDDGGVTWAEMLDCCGELPIPPYLHRETQEGDKESYQTVYSKIEGSVAAPTAGLHFTERVLDDLREKGVDLQEVTLHVGAGTFKPVKSETIAEHDMHVERIAVRRDLVRRMIAHGGNVTAVGTTSVRTLESLFYIGQLIRKDVGVEEEDLCVEQWAPYEENVEEMDAVEALQCIDDWMAKRGLEVLHASTQIMIVPGYKYHYVRKMITNFHQPKSTLLLLVSAFVKGDWRRIYDYAMGHEFRFLSYGDSSILIP